MHEGIAALKQKQRHIEKQQKIKIDLSKTEYPLLRNVSVQDFGWKVWGREDQKGEANMFWIDTYITEEFVKRLKPYQKINHFPNSHELAKKNHLSQNLKRMKQMLPTYYDFFPCTWSLPEELDKLQSEYNKECWYIVKPSSSSQGKGIYLTKQITSLPKENSIVQEYIKEPLLLDGFKFDLRLYVLIKSLLPLKVFLFDEGMGRLATHQYEQPKASNKHRLNLHLTNYAINKNNVNYIPNKSIHADNQGHKRSLSAIFSELSQIGCNIDKLKEEIDEVIMKTILSVYGKMLEAYKNCREVQEEIDSVCFQVLGFDILIDRSYKPWIIEVNHSPSFCTDTPLDLVLKKYLLTDTFLLLNIKNQEKEFFLKNKSKQQVKDRQTTKYKKNAEISYENRNMGGFHRIYPNNTNHTYSQIVKKITQKKKKSKKIQRSKNSLSEFPVQACDVYKRTTNILTLYGKFSYKNKNEEETNNQQQAIKRHIYCERQQKKIIQPIKMNNIHISFTQKSKSIKYPSGSKSYALDHKPELIKRKNSNEIKTAEGNRNDFIAIDSEIRSRIGKMKLARIKIQRMKSVDRHSMRETTVTNRSVRLASLKGTEFKNA